MPWFRRVWTIQEVALATKCFILCGYEVIPWEAFVLAAGSVTKRVEGNSTWPAMLRTLATRVWSRDYYIKGQDLTRASARIWLILTKCRREEASDPRDKILGLFTILSALGLTIPAPDYSKTPATVYEELTFRFIQQFKHLGLLQLAFTFGRDPEVPTWVPDFNDQKFFIGGNTIRKLPKMHVDSTLLIDRSPGQLPLRGKRIAEIESRLHTDNFTFEMLYNFRQPHDRQYHQLLHWARVLRDWVSFINLVNGSTGRDASHLFCWLTTKDYNQAVADAGAYAPIYRTVIENLVFSETNIIPMNDPDVPRGFQGLPDTSDGVFLYLMIRDCRRENEMNWIADCFDTVCEHNLILLSSGHIGRVPYNTEDEDIIVWLAGAHLPMVLRSVGENYTVIGPAHMHGIKEGDVWEDEEDVTELEIFTLQ
jgi:hypothetical protein